MANNTTALDGFRRIADRVRAVRETLGQAPTSVTIRVESWSGGELGSGTNTPTDTVIAPVPKVTRLSDVPSYYATGILGAATGDSKARLYEIGPMTTSYAGGGYTAEQLAPPASTARGERLVYLLSGPDFASGGEVCNLVGIDASRPHQIRVLVQSADEST